MSRYHPRSKKSKRKQLIQYGNHIVYAEGIKTEPLYVENLYEVLKERYPSHVSEISIQVAKKKNGLDPKNLLEFAVNDVKSRISNGNKIDHVWIFYDKDSFSKSDYDNTYRSIVSKNKSKNINAEGDSCDEFKIRWHACWSNECFEIWVLLHFINLTSNISRNLYISKINDNLRKNGCDSNYEKNREDLYELLEKYGNIESAIKFAKKLDYELESVNDKRCPSTGIYTFLLYFSRYLKR